jgi:hypothetical protein
MEFLIVVLIVGGALVYLIRSGWTSVSGASGNTCDCGCSGCAAAEACQEKEAHPDPASK